MSFSERKSESFHLIIPEIGTPIKSGKNLLSKVNAAEIETTSLSEPQSNKLAGRTDG